MAFAFSYHTVANLMPISEAPRYYYQFISFLNYFFNVGSIDLEGLKTKLIEHGFTSAPTQYRLYGRRFLQV